MKRPVKKDTNTACGVDRWSRGMMGIVNPKIDRDSERSELLAFFAGPAVIDATRWLNLLDAAHEAEGGR